MNWERRPEADTPLGSQRSFTDERGRHWTGSVMSGRLEGGEQRAEVLFVCDDQPTETKRVVSMEAAPREADERWITMADDEVVELFKRSEPA